MYKYKQVTNLIHPHLIFVFRWSNTFLFKTSVAMVEPRVEFSHRWKSQDLKLIHFILARSIQSLTQL